MEPVPGELWPEKRSAHAACCLNYGEVHPKMLMFGGGTNYDKALEDLWILDVDNAKWIKVRIDV